MPRVYLDHASAAPWHPAALAATLHVATELPGDPARAHAEGRAARDLLEAARAAVAGALGAGAAGVAFTSGGTEAVHLAVRGVAASRPGRIVSSAVEHTAVHAAADATGAEHVLVGVDRLGRVDLDALAATLRGGAALVNLQHANHEVGTLQPVAEAAALCREAGALLHVDACQTAGRMPVDLAALGADLVSVSGAKFGAGRGIGALAWSPARASARCSPATSARGAAGRAWSTSPASPRWPRRCSRWAPGWRRRRRAATACAGACAAGWPRSPDVEVHGPDGVAAPHIVAASALYVEGQALLAELDRTGFAVHSGSSCATTSGEPSHVLVAMGALTHGHVRASLGPGVGEPEVDAFAAAVTAAVTTLRTRAGVAAG